MMRGMWAGCVVAAALLGGCAALAGPPPPAVPADLCVGRVFIRLTEAEIAALRDASVTAILQSNSNMQALGCL